MMEFDTFVPHQELGEILKQLSLITSGIYTPTLTNTANIDTSIAYSCQWVRIGNTVLVSGRVDIDPTLGATITEIGMSLPLPSNFISSNGLAGTCYAVASGQGGALFADDTNDRALLRFLSIGTADTPMWFQFMYIIL